VAVSSTAEVVNTGGETVIRVHDGDHGTPKKASPRVSWTSPVKTAKRQRNNGTGKRKQRSIQFQPAPLAPLELQRMENIRRNNEQMRKLGLGPPAEQPRPTKKRKRNTPTLVYTPQYRMNNCDIQYVSEALLPRDQQCCTDPMPYDEFVLHLGNVVTQTTGTNMRRCDWDSTWQSAIINTRTKPLVQVNTGYACHGIVSRPLYSSSRTPRAIPHWSRLL
jgi:hypothetical protein